MNTTINGFTDQEVFDLYAFLEAYEKLYSEQDYQKNEILFEKHPELSELENAYKNINYSSKDNSSLIEKVILPNDSEQMYGLRHGSPLLSFLYHLRNSIAHTIIKKEGERIYIEDKTKNRPRRLSAKGYIQSLDIVKSFTNILNRIK